MNDSAARTRLLDAPRLLRPLKEALVAAGTRHGKPVACGYNLAFVPIFAAAHHAIVTGVLGEVREARASMYLSQTFGPRKGWMYDAARSGGGVVSNVSSHLLFLL